MSKTRASYFITASNSKDLETDDSTFIYFSVFRTRESTRLRFHDILFEVEVEVKVKVIPLHKLLMFPRRRYVYSRAAFI